MNKLKILLTCSLLTFVIAECGKEDNINNINIEDDSGIVENVISDIIVAQWNIGHFSGGRSSNSTIKGEQYGLKEREYNSLISQISADIFSVNEYSEYFGTDEFGEKHKANDVLFGEYPYQYVGHQSRYSCNALFSKLPLFNSSEIEYECNQNAKITHTTAIKAIDYYLLESETVINGILTKLVSTHLAFDKNNEDVARNQILEIIDRYKTYSNVIICGDWNIKDINNFDYFSLAGYHLANHGEFGDYITYGTKSVLDNIMVKGFIIKKVEVVESTLSDHKPIIVTLELEKKSDDIKEKDREYKLTKFYSCGGIAIPNDPSETIVKLQKNKKTIIR